MIKISVCIIWGLITIAVIALMFSGLAPAVVRRVGQMVLDAVALVLVLDVIIAVLLFVSVALEGKGP